MSERHLGALLKALRTRLTTPGNVWADRAYLEPAPPGAIRPLVVYDVVGGGAANRVRTPDASFEVQVKVIADDLATAMQGAAQLSALLDDAGTQDGGAAMDGGLEWAITTCTEGLSLHMVELVENAHPLYHAGATYQVWMGRL